MIYMYKQDLALNNLQVLICYKTHPKSTFGYSIIFPSAWFGKKLYHQFRFDLVCLKKPESSTIKNKMFCILSVIYLQLNTKPH